SQTGNVPVHVLIDNHEAQIVVGQTLYVELDIDEPAETLCVPIEAVHDEGEGPAITVVREGKAVVLHPQLGVTSGGWVAVDDLVLLGSVSLGVSWSVQIVQSD